MNTDAVLRMLIGVLGLMPTTFFLMQPLFTNIALQISSATVVHPIAITTINMILFRESPKHRNTPLKYIAISTQLVIPITS